MASVAGYEQNFDTLSSAFENGRVCIVDVYDERLKRPQAALCAVNFIDGQYEFVPFAVMCEGNPYEYLNMTQGDGSYG